MGRHLVFSRLRIPFSRPSGEHPLLGDPKTSSALPKNSIVFFLLMGGVLSGVVAQKINESIVKESFFKDHIPSYRSVLELLLSKPYKSIHDTAKDEKIEEPGFTLKKNTFYQADELNWILYTIQPEYIYFCHECNRLPVEWSEIGSGWQGFEDLLSKLDQRVFQKPLPKPKKIRAPKKDAKEIIF